MRAPMASTWMEQSLATSAAPYRRGQADRLRRWSAGLRATGALGAVVGRRSRLAATVAGAALGDP